VKINALNTDQAGKLADLIGANLNLNLEERQRLLEIRSVKDRLTHLLPLMGRESEVLTLGSKIQKEVASSMSKSQRDFFLREQIRAIQRELGESDPAASEIISLREQIEKNRLPEESKKLALKELERLQQIPPTTPEYTVSRNYLDWIVSLPWSKSTEDKIDLAAAARILDEQHYGLAKVKDRLLEYLAVIKLKNKLKGPILCLVGPPGVGKTSLGRSAARGPRSSTEQYFHRQLPRHALRLVARPLHHHRQLARPDPSRVARPSRSDRTAQLHGHRKTANRQTLSGAPPVG